MKFICTLTFIVLSVCLFSSINAVPKPRQKRTLSQEMCPTTMTDKECAVYAEEKSKEMKYCHKFFVSGKHIEWQGCGNAFCGENTRFVDEDITKPYPKCCNHCEVIDETKPAQMSATL